MNYSPEKLQLGKRLLPKTSEEINDSSRIIHSLRTQIAALITALVFTSCAGAAHKKLVSKMTLEEFIEANPNCARVIKTPDATVTDYSRCEDEYYGRNPRGGSFKPGITRPENWEEGLKYMERKKIVDEKDINWWKINMEIRAEESVVDYAKRIEELTRSFMKDRLAERNYSASECYDSKDYECLIAVQMGAFSIIEVASIFINQVIQAWKKAGDTKQIQRVETELGCELLRLTKFAISLVTIKGGPLPELEKSISEQTAKLLKALSECK